MDMAETETGLKWWIRYVIVPVIGGGGAIAIVVALISRPPASPALSGSQPTAGSSVFAGRGAGVALAAPSPTDLFQGQEKAQATKKGWWVKFDTRLQRAPEVTLRVGVDNTPLVDWGVWHAGDPPEVDLPARFINADHLTFGAKTSSDMQTVFCVMYKEAGVRRFDFDGSEDRVVRQSDRDVQCK
jgi:hypothetical protein